MARPFRWLALTAAVLVAGADASRRMDIAMMVWLLNGPDGRNVLVDASFSRDDLIIAHVHWDHFDGARLFPNARIWFQRDEFEHHMEMDGKVLDRAAAAAAQGSA